MSKQNLTQAINPELGFYGKLPSVGDFVSRRLPQEFILSWDAWLQSSLAASQEVVGEQWLQCYLTSPIWRFALSAGLSGKDSWIGIVMPSVDRVGRYFPLTIACKVTAKGSLIELFLAANDWFEDLESVALSALENDLAVEAFDAMVKSISSFEKKLSNYKRLKQNKNQSQDNPAFYLQFESSEIQTDQVFSGLTPLLLNSYLPAQSLWSTVGSENILPGFLVVNGLPSFTAYAGMITGQFEQMEGGLCQQLMLQPNNIPAENNDKANDNVNNQVDNPSAAKTGDNNTNAICSTQEQRLTQAAWKSFSRTDTGKVRKYNEDSILDRPDLGLWVVADGMGGHQAGDAASRKIINTLNKLKLSSSLDLAIIETKAALQLVNNELQELAAQMSGQDIIGSTVVALIAGKTHFACLWAGDSRLYRLRDKQLLQLTIDHCSEQEEITDVLNLGSTTGLKQNNVITRAVGAYNQLELDCQVVEVKSDDIFLLSSDGLDKELCFQEIEQVLNENNYSDAVEVLLERVLSKGARDNVSIISVEIK